MSEKHIISLGLPFTVWYEQQSLLQWFTGEVNMYMYIHLNSNTESIDRSVRLEERQYTGYTVYVCIHTYRQKISVNFIIIE